MADLPDRPVQRRVQANYELPAQLRDRVAAYAREQGISKALAASILLTDALSRAELRREVPRSTGYCPHCRVRHPSRGRCFWRCPDCPGRPIDCTHAGDFNAGAYEDLVLPDSPFIDPVVAR